MNEILSDACKIIVEYWTSSNWYVENYATFKVNAYKSSRNAVFKVILPMINQVYQLVAPRQFDVTYNVDIYGNHVIVRPYTCLFVQLIKGITQVEVKCTAQKIANVISS